MIVKKYVQYLGHIRTEREVPSLNGKGLRSGRKDSAAFHYRISVPYDGDGSKGNDTHAGAIDRAIEFITEHFVPGDTICLEGRIRPHIYKLGGEAQYGWEVEITADGFPIENKTKNHRFPSRVASDEKTVKYGIKLGTNCFFEEIEDEEDLPF